MKRCLDGFRTGWSNIWPLRGSLFQSIPSISYQGINPFNCLQFVVSWKETAKRYKARGKLCAIYLLGQVLRQVSRGQESAANTCQPGNDSPRRPRVKRAYPEEPEALKILRFWQLRGRWYGGSRLFVVIVEIIYSILFTTDYLIRENCFFFQ